MGPTRVSLGQRPLLIFALLHVLFFFFSWGGILSKRAALLPFFSLTWFIHVGFILLILFIYALIWQQVVRHLPLTVAYASKGVMVIWGMVWGRVFFAEAINWRMILGAVVIIWGIYIVSSSHTSPSSNPSSNPSQPQEQIQALEQEDSAHV